MACMTIAAAVLFFVVSFGLGFIAANGRRKSIRRSLYGAEVRADAKLNGYFRAHDLSVARQAQNQLRALYAEVLSGRVR